MLNSLFSENKYTDEPCYVPQTECNFPVDYFIPFST